MKKKKGLYVREKMSIDNKPSNLQNDVLQSGHWCVNGSAQMTQRGEEWCNLTMFEMYTLVIMTIALKVLFEI